MASPSSGRGIGYLSLSDPRPKVEARRGILVVGGQPARISREISAMAKGLPVVVTRSMDNAGLALKCAQVYPPDILLLDAGLKGLTPAQFLAAFRANARLKLVPVVVSAEVADRGTFLEAVSMGCAGFLVKPFEPASVVKHLSAAMAVVRDNERQAATRRHLQQLVEDDPAAAANELEAAMALEGDAESLHRQGMLHLAAEEWGPAAEYFSRALRLNELYADAYEGLAKAYAAQGERDKSQALLRKAVELHAKFQHLEKIREIFVAMQKDGVAMENPFLTLGKVMLREGDLLGAYQALRQAKELAGQPAAPVDVILELSRLDRLLGNTGLATERLREAIGLIETGAQNA